MLGAETGVSWGESCQREAGQRSREEHQEAQTPDGNQVCFLGPERISGTMEIGWGKLDYKKGFLISFIKKKVVFRFDFCFSEGCLCNFLKAGSQGSVKFVMLLFIYSGL